MARNPFFNFLFWHSNAVKKDAAIFTISFPLSYLLVNYLPLVWFEVFSKVPFLEVALILILT